MRSNTASTVITTVSIITITTVGITTTTTVGITTIRRRRSTTASHS